MLFEVSKKASKNGRRKFKMSLHEIYPDSCIDEVNEVGTMYNKNGITWIREYCEKAIDTIKDMSLRVEFLDDARTEINGHGETGVEDNLPVFENAVVVGHFTNGYVDTITDANGAEHTVMMGEGFIDEMCYKNFVQKLEEDMANNDAPFGSIEIFKTNDNNQIIYKYGYKDKGRIPSEFIYSGYALLGVVPADDQAMMVELNEKNKEEIRLMNEAEIKSIVEQTIGELSNQTAELNACKRECEEKVDAANKERDAAIEEKNEIAANSEKLQIALDEARNELGEKYSEIDALHDEIKALEKSLGEAKAKERVGEMNAAIAGFTDEEIAYAKEEIEAFKADPAACEINTITDKIYRVIGEKAKEAAEAEAQRIAEQNAVHVNQDDIDIFGEIVEPDSAEDVNIF